MHRKFTSKFFALIVIVTLFLSFSDSHPVGHTGAPGDGLCTDCHTIPGSFNGEVVLQGVPNDVIPGNIYSVTAEVTVTSGSPFRAGFQVVALRNSNNSQAGLWSNPGGGSSIKFGSGRQYFGHEPAQNFGSGNVVEWEADWEAPNITDEITFYIVANLTNGNGSNSGDNVILNELTVNVEEIEALELDFDMIVSTSCSDSDDGSARAVPSGGIPPYTYSWDNGESQQTAVELTGGNHTVTVTDSNSGIIIRTVLVPSPQTISFDVDFIEPLCNGDNNGSIELFPLGGTGNLSCLWEDFGAGCLQENLAAGVYEFTITDSNGCSETFDLDLEEPDELVIAVDITDDNLGNGSGSITCIPDGGISPYQFIWSTGEMDFGNTSTITGLTPGMYGVTVTDGNECSTEFVAEVGGLICSLEAAAFIQNVDCNGMSTGVITTSVMNAQAPISYLWSNGSTESNVTGVPAGIYSVTITDVNMCSDTINNIEVTEPGLLMLSQLEILNVECPSESTGIISFVVSGGTSGYDLVWSQGTVNDTLINGLDTLINIPDTLQNLSAGIYMVTVTDANGCSLVESYEINSLDDEAPNINCNNLDIVSTSCDPIFYNDPIATDNCDVVELILISGLSSGSFFPVGVTDIVYQASDANGNISLCTFTVQLDFDLVVSASVANVSCHGNDGSIELNISGGQAPYNVVPAQLDGLDAGEYIIEVTDALGCVAILTLEVLEEDFSGDYDVQVTDLLCNGFGTGSVDVIFEENPEDYNISIFPQGDLDALPAGDYQLVIEQISSGCIEISFISVGEPQAIGIDIVEYTTDPCTGEFLSAELSISGGAGMISVDTLYLDEFVTFFARDENDCSMAASILLELVDETLGIQSIEVTDSESTLDNGAIEIEVSGGTSPYTYVWTNEFDEVISNEMDLLNVGPGEYKVQVTDANGCVITTELIMVDIISSTDDELYGFKDVKIYPNPVLGDLNIQFDEYGFLKSQIIDARGKVIYDLTVRSGDNIDLRKLPPGLYFVKLIEGQNVQLIRFVKT